MKIAILGGSFDPPHRGHTAIANRLLRLNYFDQIWLMPCYQHPFNKSLSSPKKRLEMTELLERKKVKISDYEVKKKTINYSIDTLRYFAKKFPQDKFSWIIGTDQVNNFTKWKNWQEIINKFKLIVIPRTGFKKAQKQIQNFTKQIKNPKNILLIDKKIFLPIYISSTLIRKRIKEKKSISSLVPKKIEKYIIKHRLYL